MIDKPAKYYPHYMLFNRLICAGIPNSTNKFFYTPTAGEEIPTYLPAWIFTNEEYWTCLQNNRMWKNERQESFRMSCDLADQELFFADFEARTWILEFIAQHKHPHQSNRRNHEPFSELKIN